MERSAAAGFEGSSQTNQQQPRLIADNGRDLIEKYLIFINETESPIIYHRWCFLTAVGALIGRNAYIEHGRFRVFPNIYCMLIGPTGTRKSTAIKTAQDLIGEVGYAYFSAEKSSKEKFLLDLEGITIDGEPELNAGFKRKNSKIDPVTEANLWGDDATLQTAKEVFICADEFNEFTGTGNAEFYSTLGTFWDWDRPRAPYSSRLKNSRSVSIFQPTVSILGGNTAANFARAFPPAVGDPGFISRFVLVHGPRTHKKYAFPAPPDSSLGAAIVEALKKIREALLTGPINLTQHATDLLTAIYEQWQKVDNISFEGYNTRRFNYLLKLCLITAMVHGADEVTTSIVIHANTMLTAAEFAMPKAKGEFGKGKYSDIADRIINILDEATAPMNAQQLFRFVSNDLDRSTNLNEIMQSLVNSGKVQLVGGKGFLPKKAVVFTPEHVDWTTLTNDERKDVERL